MKLLLDTHLVLWAMQDSKQLSTAARRQIRAAEANYVSAASLWEIAIKASLGKLEIDSDLLEEQLDAAGFQPLPITWRHTADVRKLPMHHRDPFDRMLVAQAMSEPLRLLTHDAGLAAYTDLVMVV
ncbi:MAG TPA: type II toxin-antitoxin system VapC family toxin [Rhodanobacteraceae bacterium]|nr:type II toxin-antitoxin system VapC family toxin [Rhodanobacteraceae bacterium]